MKWYLEVLKKYVVFDGRSGREEFWWFFLFNLIVSIVLGVVDNMTGSFHLWAELGLFQGIYSLAIIYSVSTMQTSKYRACRHRAAPGQ